METSRITAGIAIVATAAVFGSTDSESESSARCSLNPFPAGRDGLRVIATTLADTLHAGVGEMEPTWFGGRTGNETPPEVYGQLVRVELLGDEVPPEVREALDVADAPNPLIGALTG